MGRGGGLPPASEVDDDFLPAVSGVGGAQKVTDQDVDDVLAEVVAAVDEGSAALELGDEVAEEVVGCGGVVEFLDAALGDDGAVVCLLSPRKDQFWG